MRFNKTHLALSAASLVVLGTTLSPSSTSYASTHSMRTTQILVNGKSVSSPKAFTYLDTTYMPIYYVQNLLTSLGIPNQWSGAQSPQVWSMSTNKNGVSLNLVAKSGTVNITVNGTKVVTALTKQVDIDPYSGQNTTFIPIWYVQMVLRALGLDNDWDGTHWTMTAKYTAYSQSSTSLGMFATLEDAEHALINYPGGTVKDSTGTVVYTQADFTNADLRYAAPANVNAGSIDQYFTSHNSPLAGLGQTIMNAQATYGVNANYLLSHAIEESAWGKSPIALAKNNLYGYGAYDADPGNAAGRYPTEEYAIRFQAWEVRNNYLTPGATYYVTPTLAGMNTYYATDKSWATNIGVLMNQFAMSQNDSVQSYVQYPSTQPVPAPSSTTEPVFYTSGYQATVQSNSYYSGLPVYSDSATGASQMFVRTIQLNDFGTDVGTVQNVLNQQMNAGLTVDGDFGPKTQAALEQFQTQHGLPATGTVDFNMWTTLFNVPTPTTLLPTGSTVTIDQMIQGMAGGNVTEWYHIVGQGWVNSSFMSLSNVYRLSVSDPTSPSDANVKVYNPSNTSAVIATLRAGDFVVSSAPSGSGGTITIQFADQSTGATVTGVVPTSEATLTQIH